MESGSPIGTHLRLVEPMGAGATGTVWRAEHSGLDAHVAVKILAGDAHLDPIAALRFGEEARAAAQINHPNILKVFDRGATEDGEPYIVMELLEGQSLRARLAQGPLPHAEAVHVVSQIAKGLDAAHQRGVIHRDLKPANVFLCHDDDLPFVKLLDFGVAKRLGEDALMMTTEGALLGTPPYMSPEQLAGVPVDPRTDLWSLGILTYEVFAGRRPFRGRSLAELIVAVEAGTFTPLGDLVAGLPSAVDDWIQRALEPNADDRFPDARAMSSAWRSAWSIPSTSPSARSSVRPPFASEVDVGAPTVPDRPVELPTARDETVEEPWPGELDPSVSRQGKEPSLTPDAEEPPTTTRDARPHATSSEPAIVSVSPPANDLPSLTSSAQTTRRPWGWVVAAALVALVAMLAVTRQTVAVAHAWRPPVPAVPSETRGETPSTQTDGNHADADALAETELDGDPPPTDTGAQPVVPAPPRHAAPKDSAEPEEDDTRTDAAGKRLGI